MWYSASLLFKGVHTPPSEKEPLWEESICLIEASTEEEATTKAERLGRSKEHSYETAEADSLTWKLERFEVCEILDDRLVHGTEVFSRYLRESQVLSLLTPPFKD